MPKGLPPKRGHEHVIVLKQGSDPVRVQPYPCQEYYKNEIENLMLLNARIILASGVTSAQKGWFMAFLYGLQSIE